MAKSLRFLFVVLTLALLAAIVYCVLGPHSYMSRIWWIPEWVGEWADRHPFFRNFPPFAALAALLFFVWQFCSPVSDIRPPISDKSFGLLSSSSLVSGLLVLRRAFVCFGAVALIATSLEFLQQLVPERALYAHPRQIMWSVAGAFVGAFGSAYITKLFAPPLPATSNP